MGSGSLELDDAVADADVPPRLRVRGGAADDAAVLEPEDRPVPRARDAAVVQLALVERAAAVPAAVRERVHGAVPPGDEHPDATHLGVARLALGQLLVAQRGGPVGRRLLERGLGDADALG